MPPEDEIEDAFDKNSVASANRARRSERDLAVRPFHESEKRECDSFWRQSALRAVLSLLGGDNCAWLKDAFDDEEGDETEEESSSDEFWFRLTTDVYDFFDVEHELLASKADSFNEALQSCARRRAHRGRFARCNRGLLRILRS